MSSTSLFSRFFYLLFILLLHLGCFFVCTTNLQSRKRKLSPNHPSPRPFRGKSTPGKAVSASWSFLKRVFTTSFKHPCTTPPLPFPPHPNPSVPSPLSTLSLHHPIIIPLTPDLSLTGPIPDTESDHVSISADPVLFRPLRNDIYPCTLCGEILTKASLLEHHQTIKHAVSELLDEDSGKNIVQIIFKTGWSSKFKDPILHRILKIHNSLKILNKFEEYRGYVKAQAAKCSSVNKSDNARCLADGNELLRFHCTTLLCDLGKNGNSSICSNQYCSACGIIRRGFSTKMDGISTLSTSWRAHVEIPEEIEEEFKFMNVKRAMLLCRVIAGRIGCDPMLTDKEDPNFDSLVGRGTRVSCRLDEEDELLVFNPRAVLPCFLIVYSV